MFPPDSRGRLCDDCVTTVSSPPQTPPCNAGAADHPGPYFPIGRPIASVGERRNFEVFTRFWRAPYRKIRSGRSTPASGPRAGARRFPTRRIVARRPGASRCGGVCVELPTPQSHCQASPCSRPTRPPAPKPPHPPSSCANVTRSRLAVCKNEKNEGSAKTGSRHLPPGHFVRSLADSAAA